MSASTVWIAPPLVTDMLTHAWEEAPREACGVLFGRRHTITEVVRITNVADAPERFFRLDDRAFVSALFSAQRRGLDLIGFYHSHPAGLAAPSPTDVAQAYYPDAVQVIIGLRSDSPVTAWRIGYGAVEPLELSIANPSLSASAPAARFIQPAVILSALVAIVMLIVLSLALLPPSPRLPLP